VAQTWWLATELRDQLVAIGLKVTNEDLVPIALNELSSSWDQCVPSVCAHEKLSNIEKLWDDFIQVETKVEIVSTRVDVTTKFGSPITYPKYLEYNVEIHVDNNIYIFIRVMIL
jgi:hypothetical protein